MDGRSAARVLSRLTARPVGGPVRGCPDGVTIAIPNWNHELLLPRSVGSALRGVRELRRHGVEAEVLVVDDFSRDGSLTLLRQLEAIHFDDGLRVLALAANAGLPVARNHALRCAAYRFVAFMDADNELVPENLHQFYRAITQTRAAVVYGNLLVEGGDGRAAGWLNNESFQRRMFQASYVDAFAMVDRLQLADAGGYLNHPDVHGCEDWELYLHLACGGRRVVFVPLVFGVYHDLAHSMVKEVNHASGETGSYIRRAFDQLSVRHLVPLNTERLRYHPDVGYL